MHRIGKLFPARVVCGFLVKWLQKYFMSELRFHQKLGEGG